MSEPHSHPYFEVVFREQSKVQLEKVRYRLLDEYDQLIFPSRAVGRVRASLTDQIVTFFSREFRSKIDSLEALLFALSRKKSITWVDMGGGLGIAMRNFRQNNPWANNCRVLNIDIVEHDKDKVPESDMAYIEENCLKIWKEENKPEFLKANIECVILPETVELITSVESIQYLNDPLAAICNWYNQLSDGGVLIIASEHCWTRGVNFSDSELMGDPNPIKPFLVALERNGIQFASSQKPHDANFEDQVSPLKRFHTLVIKKKPNTFLNLLVKVDRIWTNPYNYKIVEYEPSNEVIEVLKGNSPPSSVDRKAYYDQLLARILT